MAIEMQRDGKKLVVCYIDDKSEDRTRYSSLLSNGRVKVEANPPPANINMNSLLARRPELFLVDYELIKAESNRPTVSYRGGALANAIRESYPERPIVLLTRKNLLGGDEFPQLADVRHSFDEVLFKGDIEHDRSTARQQLLALASGFNLLRRARRRDWQALFRALNAHPASYDLLRRAAPPRSEITPEGHWRVHEAAFWIRNVLLRFPGILYDRLHAATTLGISMSSFSKSKVQALFVPAAYSGVFSEVECRWWRERLFEIAQDLISDAGMQGPINLTFGKAFKKKHDLNLEQAVCIYSKERPADCVCYILQKPVKRSYSLAYHPDDRPGVMDAARVSFKAVLEDNHVLDECFDEESLKLAKELRLQSQ
jgi:hypothetical protein